MNNFRDQKLLELAVVRWLELFVNRKLSGLIRAGSQYRPQGFGNYFTRYGNEAYCCALGAACLAITQGVEVDALHVLDTLRDYGLDIDQLISRPEIPCDQPLWRMVAILNDNRKMTREQIADWLESEKL